MSFEGVLLLANAEQAIRNTLLKIDASNVSQRRRVYESAWNAHERALLSNHALSDESRTLRRDALMKIIHKIEFEYLPDETDDETTMTAALAAEGPEEQIKIEVNGVSNLPDHKPYRAIARRRSKILLIVVPSILSIIMILGFTGWSFFNSLSGSAIIENRKKAIPQEAQSAVAAPFHQEKEKNSDWIRFFYPGDATAITTKGHAAIDIRDDGGIPYMHISANSDDDVVIIDIGAGALANMRGKKILIDIDAKGDGLQSSQLSITCDFGGQADCGRRRFEVPPNRNDILFDVDIPATSTGAAKLFLTSDLLGEGHAINIYGMKMKASQ